jgi:4-hydroxy-tetrahydrodipicolinate reductase
MNILVNGIGGKMGKFLVDLLSLDEEATLVAGVDKFADPKNFSVPVFSSFKDVKDVKVDALIDFSRPDALQDILDYSLKNNVAAVICTTGLSDEQINSIKEASKKVPMFRSSNMSVGINVVIELCKKASKILNEDVEIEIIEQHHNQKVDAPSGTAIAIADAINEEYNNEKNFVYGRSSKNQKRDRNEIGIHAIRGGTIVGKHDVMFIGHDEIVTIGHEAQSRAVFAKGAIKAAKFLYSVKKPGLYNMSDLVNQIV